MDKAIEIQRQCRDNVNSLQSYITDLNNWEAEMKRKESALNGDIEQELPPVRSKQKREKPIVVTDKPKAQRIPSSDYKSWDQFDVDKACEEIDMSDAGPISLDGKKSIDVKKEKLKEEAQYEKERGNKFVKLSKWDDAISCYNRAIELYDKDAIFYANRGLCYLKKEKFNKAEYDCTSAITLDPTYVKAFQRRAAARTALCSLRAAASDLKEVLKLEPHNKDAKVQLEKLQKQMGTKGPKSKSSPATTPTTEKKPSFKYNKAEIQTTNEGISVVNESRNIDRWKDGSIDGVTVIQTADKPTHLRSKKPLKVIPIHEIELGCTDTLPIFNKPSKLKIVEIEDEIAPEEGVQGDSIVRREPNDSYSTTVNDIGSDGDKPIAVGDSKSVPTFVNGHKETPVSVKETNNNLLDPASFVIPTTSVQFILNWKLLNTDSRAIYLSMINPSKLPQIFQDSLESELLSQILYTLNNKIDTFQKYKIYDYLNNISQVKRFSTLCIFMSSDDKKYVKSLLEHCQTNEGQPDSSIEKMKIKFEI